jgi:hypothetical protein
MKRILIAGALAAALALPMMAAPTAANASCSGRKLTGTVIGGVGGALIGNSISRGGAGAVVGGLGGAYLGHEIAAHGCGRARASADGYYHTSSRGRGDTVQPERQVYYDRYGAPMGRGAASENLASTSDPYDRGCRTEMRDYYDNRGALVQSPVRVCTR